MLRKSVEETDHFDLLCLDIVEHTTLQKICFQDLFVK